MEKSTTIKLVRPTCIISSDCWKTKERIKAIIWEMLSKTLNSHSGQFQ